MFTQAPDRSSRGRRGAVGVAMLLVVMIGSLLVIQTVNDGARDQDLALRRVDTVRALYAAEAGMNMAIGELLMGVDADGDGGVGSISDDGNSANDPAFGDAAVTATVSSGGGVTTVESEGRCGGSRSRVLATAQ